ncbi:YwbE family protein [Bacillus sp. BML-BC060]|uniref:YwbE family protein n=1 Tax=Bacillus sp. BML-BC060 TaxID=2842487 RepID=UPI001C809894|nr:YwbE family protein [Bacillus sp. BML-BC060]
MLKKLLFFVLLSLCVMSLSACKGDEEKLKVASDEQKIDEDKKVAEEEKRKQEEQQRVEEEKRKQEEQQRVEEEKRKQQEQKTQQQQSIQQERTQKQEKTTQATGGKPTRSQISVGSHVVIQLDNNYSKTVSGVVKDILTHSETHTYGIKVRLQDGQIGRVQSVN